MRERDKTTSTERITVKAQYPLPQPGLLTPDRIYYWHVRAQDDKGVWGPWSKTWSFTPRGPTHPLDVMVEYDQAKRSGPSDYSVAPRPVIHSRPVVTARVGTEYRYQVLANRSLGDLSSRTADGQQTRGYFDIEKPRFTLIIAFPALTAESPNHPNPSSGADITQSYAYANTGLVL